MRSSRVAALFLIVGIEGALAQPDAASELVSTLFTSWQGAGQFRAKAQIGQKLQEIDATSDLVQRQERQNQREAAQQQDQQPQVTFIEFRESGETRTSDWIGNQIVTPEDEEIGVVEDLLIDSSGMVEAVIVSVGGFLKSENRVAIPFDAIQVEQQAGQEGVRLVANLTREELEQAPAYACEQAGLQPVRSFTGPHAFPPREFGAYGIVAFPFLSTPTTKARHLMVCRAFIAALPDPGSLVEPLLPDQMMVTVWPVNDEAFAKELNAPGSAPEQMARCDIAVDQYHLDTAQTALRQADVRNRGIFSDKRGPFLLAWSPSSSKGKEDALVLIRDLSNFSDLGRVQQAFNEWRIHIETNSNIFDEKWTIENLRSATRDWLNRVGSVFLAKGAS